MRLLAAGLTLAVVLSVLLVGQTSAASAKQEKCKVAKQSIQFYREKTWQWEKRLDVDSTKAELTDRQLALHNGCMYLRWISKLWKQRSQEHRKSYEILGASVNSLDMEQLHYVAQWEIRHGGIYSSRWGDASPRLKEVCYELVERAFARFGTSSWAYYVVNRESGCNPGAVNSRSSTTGIAQIHPDYHDYNYTRMKRDMRYALRTFIGLSNGGHNTGPWCLC